MTFASIRSEGALLPPDLLARIAQLDKEVPGLTAADYRLADGERFGEVISRAWARLLAAWRSFQAERARLPTDDPATTVTRERFLQPLLQELGYGRVPTAKAITVDGRDYAISHAWGQLPIHLLGAGVSLETKVAGVAGAARSSPHGLVQDLLNRSDAHLWALLSNGLVLRLLRDHHSLTTQAYVEVDLEAMFEGERYADFALLWLVFHQSRVEAARPEDCWLEKWFALSREQGVRALDDLRAGVERAIEAFGAGFLRHPHNTALVRDLADGVLDRQDYYRELLRLVYRLIFLFSAEDRDVLLDPAAPEAARARYQRYYATRALRDLAGSVRGGPHGDLWERLRLVMASLDEGAPALALPALGSFLWSKDALPHLGGAALGNEDLLTALRALSYLERDRQRFPIAWRTVAADELGSLYEGLLELHPSLDAGAGTFELTTAAGNDRKKTGSYYTPTSLVDCLLDSALDPVIDAAVAGKPRDAAERALLDLKVVDPACGSGHFLVAAARRLARRLAALRTGDDEASPPELRRALRDVVGRCVFGVDLNEMAVELCKVALWMEAVEPGRPLSFLDAHIQHGNALIGATPALLARGIPDDAWDPIEGDDKAVARALKRRNRDARRQAQGTMWDAVASPGATELVTAARDALAGGDDALADVRARKRRWETLQSSPAFRDAVFIADTWCAAFVWPKQDGPLAAEAPTEEIFARVRKDPASASRVLRSEVAKLARQYTFFHWHLAFPDVFQPRAASGEEDVTGWDGGFDCVLGNPPWEHVELKEIEWFAVRSPAISRAENASKRKKLIEALKLTDIDLWNSFRLAQREHDGHAHFPRQCGRFPLCARGRINTYALFAECARMLTSRSGRCGQIVPSGIATDDNTKHFFHDIASSGQLISLYEFENEGFFSAGRGHMIRFALTTIAGRRGSVQAPEFLFQGHALSDLGNPDRRFRLERDDFATINPNTLTCPIFQWSRDAIINRATYRRFPVLIRDNPPLNPWGVSFMQGVFNTASDSALFINKSELDEVDEKVVPLYEAKMVHLFNHRHADFRSAPFGERPHRLPENKSEFLSNPTHLPEPYYWVRGRDVEGQLGDWTRPWMLVWRDVTDARASARTLITTAIPRAGCGDTLLIAFPTSEVHPALLLSTFASLPMDYFARQKVGGLHLKYNVMKQLPVVPPGQFLERCDWEASSTLSEWILPRVVELIYTADDMGGFAVDCGYESPPFRWDAARRAILRAELDAAFFHLYGLDRSDTEYVLGTFPVLRDKETREHGEYRTARLVLDRYDALAEAIATGKPYQTPLDPPPADPRAAHPAN